MDWTQVIKWAGAAVARGIAWILVAKLGYDAATADTTAAQAAEAIGALVIVGISVYTSVKGRKTLLATTPPDATAKP